jgi:hypothetical protein
VYLVKFWTKLSLIRDGMLFWNNRLVSFSCVYFKVAYVSAVLLVGEECEAIIHRVLISRFGAWRCWFWMAIWSIRRSSGDKACSK